MSGGTDDPKQALDAVEEEIREQAAIDQFDEPPAAKVERRDLVRSTLEDELGVEPDPGPNPS